jgi:NitT/TauT family transport system ATP-binding protein
VEPAVLLMDEPFSALDCPDAPAHAGGAARHLGAHPADDLYVTHNIHEAVWMADRVVVLSRRPGRVLEIVPVKLPRPRTEAMLASRASCRRWSGSGR